MIQLKTELRRRSLQISSTKKELIARFENDDPSGEWRNKITQIKTSEITLKILCQMERRQEERMKIRKKMADKNLKEKEIYGREDLIAEEVLETTI